jgi:hypothetical protein
MQPRKYRDGRSRNKRLVAKWVQRALDDMRRAAPSAIEVVDRTADAETDDEPSSYDLLEHQNDRIVPEDEHDEGEHPQT